MRLAFRAPSAHARAQVYDGFNAADISEDDESFDGFGEADEAESDTQSQVPVRPCSARLNAWQ